jgi:hypothetical protein
MFHVKHYYSVLFLQRIHAIGVFHVKQAHSLY